MTWVILIIMIGRQLPNRTIRIFVGTWNMNGQVYKHFWAVDVLLLLQYLFVLCFKMRVEVSKEMMQVPPRHLAEFLLPADLQV